MYTHCSYCGRYCVFQEELKLSVNRHSSASVISDLLLRIPRSLKKHPTWWEVLEEVLMNLEYRDLYYAMSQYFFFVVLTYTVPVMSVRT